MSFLRSKPKVNSQQMAEIARQKSRDDLAQRRAQEAAKEQEILETVGNATDPLADETLYYLNLLPATERPIFLRNVMRQLVVHALKTEGHNIDKERAEGLPYNGIWGFGTGSVAIEIGQTAMQDAVLRAAIGKFEQPQLDLENPTV